MNKVELRRRDAFAQPVSADESIALSGLQPDAPTGSPPLLTQLLTIITRRKWIILGAVIGALVAGLLVTLLMTPRYTAFSTVDIQREGTSFIAIEGAEPATSFVDQEFYETQYGLLRARSLAERVASDLKLGDDAKFFEMFGSTDATDWFENGRLKPNASRREQRVEEAAELLLKNVAIVPERLSRLVVIQFTAPEPFLAQRIVDAWARNFIQITLERRFEATSYARKFLEDRLTQLRSRIDESERRLVDYASREGIVNLPGATAAPGSTSGGERSLVADNLVNLNRELSEATAERVRAQSRLSAGLGQVTEALENPAIAMLRQRRAELSADYAKLMTQFQPDYPPALALRTQIDQLDRSIAREESRVQSTLRETFQSSQAREANLQRQVNQLESGVLDLRRRSIQYNIYQRDADTNRQLYDALLQRYKEIGVAGGVGVNNISIVDTAQTPKKPSSPRLPLNLALALLAGLVLGIGAALALEQLEQGIVDPAEVEQVLGIPLLGTIPKVADEDPMEALSDRKSSVTEAYTSLQTSLAFSTDHGVPRTVAVTSTRPGEGKTTTAYALARSLARSERRVVLVDTDMRSPSVHHLVDLDNKKGLSNYLVGAEPLHAVLRSTQFNGLEVISAGPQPPSAPDLLSGEAFDRLLSELLQKFDHVVVDAPPVMGLADAPLVGSRVEGVVFVVESHATNRNMARVAIGRLLATSSPVVGAALTKFDSKRAHYGYGYDYGYGYSYGPTAKQS